MYTRLICAFYYYVSLSLSYFSKIAYSKTSVSSFYYGPRIENHFINHQKIPNSNPRNFRIPLPGPKMPTMK